MPPFSSPPTLLMPPQTPPSSSSLSHPPYTTALSLTPQRSYSASPHPHARSAGAATTARNGPISGSGSGSGSPVRRSRHAHAHLHLRSSKSSSSAMMLKPHGMRISKPSIAAGAIGPGVAGGASTAWKCDENELLGRLERLRILDERQEREPYGRAVGRDGRQVERVNWEGSRGCGVGDYLDPYQSQAPEEHMSLCTRQQSQSQSQSQWERERERDPRCQGDQNQDPFFAARQRVDASLDSNMDTDMMSTGTATATGFGMDIDTGLGVSGFGRASFFK
ncbi:hypothetical protein PVAG01_01647 [Phlyctema vagabunda]|uniref:Uncharacterized protein n=1 Tax=Phlyctema vagabunda TaxID=108571 RepID=A0ABR4PY77_9HELO